MAEPLDHYLLRLSFPLRNLSTKLCSNGKYVLKQLLMACKQYKIKLML